jgi:dTMP kinase
MRQGPFVIAVCGIDGSGKSSQVQLLASHLSGKGYRVKITKAKMINSEILFTLSEKLFGDRYDYHPNIPPLIMNVILACDVAHHYLNECEDWKDYDVVICDRHKLCYEAYSLAYGTEMEWVIHILSLIKNPDVTIYIETPFQIAMDRLKNRRDKPIRSDETPEILEACLISYHEIMDAYDNVYMIDGSRGIDEVHAEVVNRIRLEIPYLSEAWAARS